MIIATSAPVNSSSQPRIIIIDYGLGNLFSIKNACEWSGMQAEITSSKQAIFESDGVILPGVGAFGDAMTALRELGLIAPIHRFIESGKPLLGICLGLQLLFSRSHEFGEHEGLDIIRGEVVRFNSPKGPDRVLKVPQIGWNQVLPPGGVQTAEAGKVRDDVSWMGTPLEGIKSGTFMYFVHSYYGNPEDSSVILSTTTYGDLEFCSAVRKENVFAFQFHPERSGPAGLMMYHNLRNLIGRRR